jgi:gamma-butyrobetaine dioxygenase
MANVELYDDWLRVPLAGGHADFHFKWLRHQCDLDRHPATRERVVDSSEIPDDIRPRAARVADDALLVEWAQDGRTSRYALSFLEQHAYARNRDAAPPPGSDLERITLRRSGPIEDAVRAALERLDAFGAVVVRRDPSVTDAPEDETERVVDAFAAKGLRVIATHFGRIEDLRTDNTTNQNTDQLGYTDAAIELHTDQPFLDGPPRLQLLQSIRAAAQGGENYVVDARAAALYLRDVDRRSFEVLTTVPVHFHRKQKAFESLVVSPILKFSDDGRRFQVRSSYFTMAPFQRPFDEMAEWYRAYDRFSRMVRDPRHQYRFALAAGDFVLYDNHRMLHARTSFRGARWVRGIYFDR